MYKNNCNEYIYNRYNGVITTYKKIRDKEYLCIETGLTICFDNQLLLGKTSENIIDLIEVGDYINGKRCVDIEEYVRDDGTTNISFICLGGSVLTEDIKSIVTKEMFLNAEYRVETN